MSWLRMCVPLIFTKRKLQMDFPVALFPKKAVYTFIPFMSCMGIHIRIRIQTSECELIHHLGSQICIILMHTYWYISYFIIHFEIKKIITAPFLPATSTTMLAFFFFKILTFDPSFMNKLTGLSYFRGFGLVGTLDTQM